MKRFLALIVAVAMVATFVGCIQITLPNAGGESSGTTINTNNGEKPKTLEWQEKSFGVIEGEHGGKYNVVIKISPWILKSTNPDLIRTAWAEVGQGEILPEKIEDWQNVSVDAETSMYLSHGPGYGWFSCSMIDFDMYYALGAVVFELVDCYSSKDLQSFYDVSLFSELFVGGPIVDENGVQVADNSFPMLYQVFYGDDTEMLYGYRAEQIGLRLQDRTVKASEFVACPGQGPTATYVLPFVIMHGEARRSGDRLYYREMMSKEKLCFFRDYESTFFSGYSIKESMPINYSRYSGIEFVLEVID